MVKSFIKFCMNGVTFLLMIGIIRSIYDKKKDIWFPPEDYEYSGT